MACSKVLLSQHHHNSTLPLGFAAGVPVLFVKVWKRSVPGSDFVAIKSSAILGASPQALFEVLTPGDIDIVRRVGAETLSIMGECFLLGYIRQ